MGDFMCFRMEIKPNCLGKEKREINCFTRTIVIWVIPKQRKDSDKIEGSRVEFGTIVVREKIVKMSLYSIIKAPIRCQFNSKLEGKLKNRASVFYGEGRCARPTLENGTSQVGWIPGVFKTVRLVAEAKTQVFTLYSIVHVHMHVGRYVSNGER